VSFVTGFVVAMASSSRWMDAEEAGRRQRRKRVRTREDSEPSSHGAASEGAGSAARGGGPRGDGAETIVLSDGDANLSGIDGRASEVGGSRTAEEPGGGAFDDRSVRARVASCSPQTSFSCSRCG
jgi:hypothetical protein